MISLQRIIPKHHSGYLFVLICFGITLSYARKGQRLRPIDDDQYSALGRLNLNTDPRYSRWPNPTHVPYVISSDYTPAETALIRDAMQQIFLDTLGCVRFVDYDQKADLGQDYVIISPAIDGTCWSYPGLLPAEGAGQKLGISAGKDGCLDNKRLIMKTLFHVLGKRSEHNRPDRDDYLDMHPENLDPAFVPFNPYQKYLDSTVYYQGFPYDYNSITHHLPTAYAQPGKTVFTIRDLTKNIGDKPRLSYWDCYAMAIQYQCQDIIKNDLCRNLDSYKPTITVLAGVPTRDRVQPTSSQPAKLPNNNYYNNNNINDNDVASIPVQPQRILTPPPTTRTTSSTRKTTMTTKTTTTRTTPTTTTTTTTTEEPFPDFQGNMVSDPTKADYVTLQRKNVNAMTKRNICDLGFRVDAAVQNQDGRIMVFAGNDYYMITAAGYIQDGPLPITRDFPDLAALPITATFTTFDKDQKITHIIAAQNDYTYVDFTFLDYLPIVEDDLLLPNLQTVFTLPSLVNSGAVYEFRIYNGFEPNVQFIQAGSRGKKVPLLKSKFFIGNATQVPPTIDALVSFKMGSLGNTVDVALVFSGDMMHLMDVDYSCLSTLKFPCLNATKRTRFPLPIRSILNCNAYASARSYVRSS